MHVRNDFGYAAPSRGEWKRLYNAREGHGNDDMLAETPCCTSELSNELRHASWREVHRSLYKEMISSTLGAKSRTILSGERRMTRWQCCAVTGMRIALTI
jgi:hypothetical protein